LGGIRARHRVRWRHNGEVLDILRGNCAHAALMLKIGWAEYRRTCISFGKTRSTDKVWFPEPAFKEVTLDHGRPQHRVPPALREQILKSSRGTT